MARTSLDLDGRLGRIAADQFGAFSRTQAVACGATSRQLRLREQAGRIERAAHDVFVVAGAPRTWRQRLAVCSLTGEGVAVVSHLAAARLHGLEGVSGEPLEVSVVRGRLTAGGPTPAPMSRPSHAEPQDVRGRR